jgi:hypothetical protein
MGIGEGSFILELEVEQPEGGPGRQSPLGRLQYDPVGQFGGASRLRAFAVNPRPLRPEGLDAQNAIAGGGGVVAGEVGCECLGVAADQHAASADVIFDDLRRRGCGVLGQGQIHRLVAAEVAFAAFELRDGDELEPGAGQFAEQEQPLRRLLF